MPDRARSTVSRPKCKSAMQEMACLDEYHDADCYINKPSTDQQTHLPCFCFSYFSL